MNDANKHDSAGFSAIIIVLDMISVQLEDIAKDVEASVAGVCSGFTGMSTRARTALKTAAEALDSSDEGGGLQAFVHRVSMALEVMLQRIESSRDFSRQVSAEIEDLSVRFDAFQELNDYLVKLCELSAHTVSNAQESLANGFESDEVLATLLEHTTVISSAANLTNTSITSFINGISSSVRKLASRVRNQAEADNDASTNSEVTVRNMLDRLSVAYERMAKSLSNSAAMSRQLNLDIGQAVVSMQFQDRVNQRIQHLVETIVDLAKELQPYTKAADKSKVKAISDYWMQRAAEKSTMNAERVMMSPTESAASDEGSIELF